MAVRSELVQVSRAERAAMATATAIAVIAAVGFVRVYPRPIIYLIFGLGITGLSGWVSLALAVVGAAVWACIPKPRIGVYTRSEFLFGLVKCQFLFFVLTCFAHGLTVSLFFYPPRTPIGFLKDYAFTGMSVLVAFSVQVATTVSLVVFLVLRTGRRPVGSPWGAAALALCVIDVLLVQLLRLSVNIFELRVN